MKKTSLYISKIKPGSFPEYEVEDKRIYIIAVLACKKYSFVVYWFNLPLGNNFPFEI